MASGTSIAVTEAARLDEIGFPEFTTKLVTDVFDTLISANIRQIQSFQELLAKTALSLKDYINQTQDDIGGDQILQLLAKVLPSTEDGKGFQALEAKPDGSAVGMLEAAEVDALKTAVALPAEAGQAALNVPSAAPIDNNALQAIRDAVAKRIASDNFAQLKQLVQMGMQRIVVEKGLIETRLTFNTYGSSLMQTKSSTHNRDAFALRASAGTGSLSSAWFKASASTSYNRVKIKTTNETNRDSSGSSVQIFGRVQIEFKTDFRPLTDNG